MTGEGARAGIRLRRAGLALVMVGALSVSVRGQVEAVTPLLGGMSVVLALTNDLAALLALNELMATRRPEVRRWSWAVLVPAGGTAAGLNTWHAVGEATLPPAWAVVVGIGPVLLAVVLSHLVALVLSEPPPEVTAEAAERDSTPRAATPAPQTAQEDRPTAVSGPGAHHGLTVVPSPPDRPTPGGRGGPSPAASDRPDTKGADEVADPRVQRLVAQLRGGAQLTGAAVARQLGCSPRTGRRLLRQAEDQLTVAAATSEMSGRRWELPQ